MRVGDGIEKVEREREYLREREIVGRERGSGRGRERGDGSVCVRETE